MVLAALASFDATEGEKLRWFAIWLEEHELPAWSVLGAVYAEAVRALQPGGKVLRLLGDEAGCVRLGYGAVTVRMRPSLFHVVDVLVHEPGDALVLADGRGAEVLDVHWHHQRAEPMYRLRVAGKVRSRRYWNEDVRRPAPS